MTKATAQPANFEDALKELEAIVRKLEGGQQDLEASINDYVRGTELKSFCEQKLKDARMKVESILQSQDGSITTKAFEEKISMVIRLPDDLQSAIAHVLNVWRPE